MPRSGVVALTLVVGLILSACAQVGAATEVKADAPRASADPAAALGVRAALDAFSADLYKALAREPGNLVLSPYGVAVALAMTSAGARGETAAQIGRVLHVENDPGAGFNVLEQELAKRPGKYKVGDGDFALELATANRLWGQNGLTFERTFLDTLARYYGAGMQIVDYKAAPEPARRSINDWVADRTRGRIKDLIPQGVIDVQTRLVLTNAIYLKASWMLPFAEGQAAPFHRTDGTDVQAKTMRLNESLRYGVGEGYQAVQLRYVGGLSMVVIVPDRGKLGAFERSLDGAAIRRLVDGMRSTQVILSLPKFTFTSQAQLKEALSQLGMPLAFTDRADLSGITKEERLEIADVVHKAFIAVDEKGTEAAAATGVVFRTTSAPANPIELRIDRPFLFLIQDDATGAILFLGRVGDPTAT